MKSYSVRLLLLCTLTCSATLLVVAQKQDCKKEPEKPKPHVITLAMKCDFPAVTDLIASGTAIETKDEEGNTLLKFAVEAECEKLVDFLLTAGANPNARSIYNRTPFTSATARGPVSLVKRLLALGADAKAADKFGWTTLFDAKNLEVMKALVEAGAEVNAQDKDGMTALMHSAMGCDEDEIAYLISKGADVNARNALGITALGFASCPYPRVINSLVAAGADINAADNEGLTPLMRTMGYPDTTEIFLHAGADVNLSDKEGKTALDHAMKIDTFTEEIVAILKKAGAVSGKALQHHRGKRPRR
jgi:ankyrin repeat protein